MMMYPPAPGMMPAMMQQAAQQMFFNNNMNSMNNMNGMINPATLNNGMDCNKMFPFPLPSGLNLNSTDQPMNVPTASELDEEANSQGNTNATTAEATHQRPAVSKPASNAKKATKNNKTSRISVKEVNIKQATKQVDVN